MLKVTHKLNNYKIKTYIKKNLFKIFYLIPDDSKCIDYSKKNYKFNIINYKTKNYLFYTIYKNFFLFINSSFLFFNSESILIEKTLKKKKKNIIFCFENKIYNQIQIKYIKLINYFKILNNLYIYFIYLL